MRGRALEGVAGGRPGEAEVGGGLGAVLGRDGERAGSAAGVGEGDAVAGGIDRRLEFRSTGGVDGVDNVADGGGSVERYVDVGPIADGNGEVRLAGCGGGDAVAVVERGQRGGGVEVIDVGAGEGIAGGGAGDAKVLRRAPPLRSWIEREPVPPLWSVICRPLSVTAA